MTTAVVHRSQKTLKSVREDVWEAFAITAIKERQSHSQLFEKAMTEYMKKSGTWTRKVVGGE